MRKTEGMKKVMSLLLALSMVLSYVPVPAFAAEDGLCEHHAVHTGCAYAAPWACTHECTESCLTEEKISCIHDHAAEGCTYTEPEAGVECDHVCPDDGCGYAAEVAAVDCTCLAQPEHTESCASLNGEAECDCGMPVQHTEDCAYQAAVAGTPCAHQCAPELCSFRAAVAGGWSCAHECTVSSGCVTMVCGHVCEEGKCMSSGVPCDYVCSECSQPEQTPECVCEKKCTSDSILADCPVCGSEGADLSLCLGEEEAEQLLITRWEWVDEWDILEDGAQEAVIPNVSAENPVDWDTLISMLPAQIKAVIAGEEVSVALEWECEDFPEEGASGGTYVFRAVLPDGYVLEEGQKELKLSVVLGTARQLDGTATWDGTVADQAWESGTGTETDPYLIMTSQQLAKLAADVNSGTNYAGMYFQLGADLDMNGSSHSWTAIGKYNYPFKGTFDGAGKTVSNLKTDGTSPYVGFFGNLENAKVTGLTVADSYFKTTNKNGTYVGAIAGYCKSSTIENCHNSGSTVINAYFNTGGIVGYCTTASQTAPTTVSGCTNTGAITAGTRVGGIVGDCAGYTRIADCENSGTVQLAEEASTTAYIGGIVGFCEGTVASVENCTNNASVSGASWVGGIAGSNRGKISGCKNTSQASVTGTSSEIGGIVGANNGTVTGCTNSAAVKGGWYVGGIAGSGVNLSGCTNTGAVNANTYGAGGVIGYVYLSSGTATVENCHNEGKVQAATKYTGGLVGHHYGGRVTYNGCSNKGDVESSGHSVGGLVGWGSNATVKNCYNTGSVKGVGSKSGSYCYGIGGLCGTTFSACIFENSHNSGNVNGGSTPYVGGLVGSFDRASGSAVNYAAKCYNTGSVTGGSYVGGLFGYYKPQAVSENCYNTGSVSGTSYVGGLAGYEYYSNHIKNSYNAGSVSGSSYFGGVIGNSASVGNCYYLDTCVTAPTSKVGTALTAEQMTDDVQWASNFSGFDTDVWSKQTPNTQTQSYLPRLDSYSPYLSIVRHVHTPEYSLSADGKTVTVTCSGADCDLEDAQKLLGIMTLSGPASNVYDGNEKNATLSFESWLLDEAAKPVTADIVYTGESDRVNVTGNTVTASVTLGSRTASVSFTIEKADQDAPDAPQLAAAALTAVTLKPVTAEGKVVQYAVSSVNTAPADGWQSSVVFEGLSENNTYYFFARYGESANYNPSAASPALAVELTACTVTMDLKGGILTEAAQEALASYGAVNNGGILSLNVMKGTSVTVKLTSHATYLNKRGYTFLGIRDTAEGGTAYTDLTADITVTVNGNVNYEVLWEETTYAITVTASGNGTAAAKANGETVTKAVEGAVITLEAFADNGYRLKEWQVLSGGVTVSGGCFTVGTEDVKIHAVFEEIPPEYTVTWMSEGEVFATTAVCTGDALVLPAAEPARTGHSFLGWFTEESGGEQVDGSTVFAGTDNTTVYYARWDANPHTVTWVIDDPINDDNDLTFTQNVRFGDSITQYAPTVPENYYGFRWKDTVPATAPDEDITVNGVWTVRLTLLDPEGNNVEVGPGGVNLYRPDNSVCAVGEETYANYMSTYGKTGYVFWLVNVEDPTERYQPDLTYSTPIWPNITMDRNKTYQGVFLAREYSVTWNLNGCTYLENQTDLPAKLPYNGDAGDAPHEVLIYGLEAPEGCRFIGFRDADGNDLPFSDSNGCITLELTVTGDMTVNAIVERITYGAEAVESGSLNGAPFLSVTNAEHGMEFTALVRTGKSDAWYCDVLRVTADGKELTAGTDYTYDVNSARLTVAGEKVTGKIEVYAQVNARVTFDLNGGDVTEEVRQDLAAAGVSIQDGKFTIPMAYGVESPFGTTVEALNRKFVKTGHSCTGLKNGDKDAVLTNGLVNCVLTLQWEPETYDASFDANGGAWENGDTVRSIPTVFGTGITAPEDPARTGYSFTGWTPHVGNMTGADMTFTASWTPNSYDAVFTANGGAWDDGDTEKTVSAVFDQTITAPADPRRPGYSFAGWEPAVEIMDDVQGKTFAASWIALKDIAYVVETYEMDITGSYPVQPTGSIPCAGETDTFVEAAPLIPVGFALDDQKSVLRGKVAADGSLVLKVYFRRLQVTVAFDTDGGSEIAPIIQYYGTAVTAPADPVKTGHTFAGWDKEIPETVPAEDVTVKALWNVNSYTLTFDTDGGTRIDPITRDYGAEITAPAAPVKTGHTFAGWDKVIPETMPAENMTVKALWNVNSYTVTFDTDGGSEIAPITRSYGAPVTAPAAPTKEGYTFTGWDKVIPETMPAENMTVKALWKLNTYTVTYVADGRTVDTQTVEHGKNASAPEIPAREGYDQTAPRWDHSGENITSDTVITAIYTVNTYKVTYVADGVTVDTQTVSHGGSAAVPVIPFKEGHDHVEPYWNHDGKNITADTTITAVYTPNSYTVTYVADGKTVEEQKVTYGSNAVAPGIPAREGYDQTAPYWDHDGKNITSDITVTAVYTVNRYVVRYMVDGQVIHREVVNHGEDAPACEIPVREGCTQTAPYWAPEGRNITSDTDLHAVYTLNTYTVIFLADGKGVDTQQVRHGEAAVLPQIPAREGYDKTAPYWDHDGKNITSDLTVNAVYTVNTYTVTYVAEGVTVDTQTVEHGADASAPEIPAREGYDITAPYWDHDGKNITSDLTVNAVYTVNTYTVTVSGSQQGYSLSVDAQQVSWKESVNVLFTLAPGYSRTDSFAVTANGIPVTLDEEGRGTVSGITENTVITVTGVEDITPPGVTVTLKDNWNSLWNGITFGYFFKETQTFTVTAEDSGSGVASVHYYLAAAEVADPKTITEWTEYTAAVKVDPDKVFIIYAKVADKAGNVVYVNSDGFVLDKTAPVISGIEDGGVYYGDTAVQVYDAYLDRITLDGEPVRTENGSFVIPADNEKHVVIATDKAGNETRYQITVFRMYKVTYMVDGKEYRTVSVRHGQNVDPVPDVPAKPGYDAVAPRWDHDGKNITEDLVIRAVYTANEYKVTFVIDGAVVETVTVLYGEDVTLPQIPAKEGYDQTVPYWDHDGKNITSDTTVTAVYTVNTYRVTYVADGVTVSEQRVAHGSNAAAPEIPAKPGHDQTAPRWDHNGKDIRKDTVITAVYTVNQYKVILPDPMTGYTLTADKLTPVYHDTVNFKLTVSPGYNRTVKFQVTVNGTAVTPDKQGRFAVTDVESDLVLEVLGIADTTAPAVTIQVADNAWKQFLNTVTFQLFFRETQQVTVTASDAGSGLKSVEYLLSSEPLTLAQVKASREWKAYTDSFSVSPENQYVVYARAKDNAGWTTYVSSDGLVLDQTSPVISGVEAGGVYYTTQKVEAQDNRRLKTLTLNAETFNGYVPGDPEAETVYTVAAEDMAGNTSSIRITMLPIESLMNGMPTMETLKLSDKAAIEARLAKVTGIQTYQCAHATDGEKQELKQIAEDLDAMLAEIEAAEQVIALINAMPDYKTTEPDDKPAIDAYDKAIAAYEALSDTGKRLVGTANKLKLELMRKALTAYKITKGSGARWTKNSGKTLSFTANGYYAAYGSYKPNAYGKFVELEIDGKALDTKHYTVKAGSTVATLDADYLQGLSTGEHKITFIYTDGETNTGTFRILSSSGNPSTSDPSNPMLWAAITFGSLICMVCLLLIGRRKRQR